MDNYSIRNYLLPGDLSQVASLHAKIYFGEHGFGFEMYVIESLVEFYKQQHPEKDGVWVVEPRGKLVGFLLLMHRPDNQAQIRHFILEKAY